MKYTLNVVTILVALLVAVPASAFFNPLPSLPGPDSAAFDAETAWEVQRRTQCTAIHAMLGLNVDLCARAASQQIQRELRELEANGVLEVDLEHMTARTSAGSDGERLTNVRGHSDRTSTRTASHATEQDWASYDDIWSCEEYVYKRFQQVRDFQISVEANANDIMTVARDAFERDGIGFALANGRELTGRNGQTFPDDQPAQEAVTNPLVGEIWGTWLTTPRNDFYDLTSEQIEAVAAHSSLTSSELWDGRYGTWTYVSPEAGWDLHADRYDALQDVQHSTLRFFYDQRQAFRAFIAQRERHRETLLFHAPGTRTSLVEDLPADVDPELTSDRALDSLYLCLHASLQRDCIERPLEDLTCGEDEVPPGFGGDPRFGADGREDYEGDPRFGGGYGEPGFGGEPGSGEPCGPREVRDPAAEEAFCDQIDAVGNPITMSRMRGLSGNGEELADSGCRGQYEAAVTALRVEMHSYNVQLGEWMERADAMGCTEGTTRYWSPTSVCDWAPEDFIQDVSALVTMDGASYADRMEQERVRCQQTVHDDSALWAIDRDRPLQLKSFAARGVQIYKYFEGGDALRARGGDADCSAERLGELLGEAEVRVGDGTFTAEDMDVFLGRAQTTLEVQLEAAGCAADAISAMEAQHRPRLQTTGSGGRVSRHDLNIPFVDGDADVISAGYNYAYDLGLIDAEHVSGLRTRRGPDGSVFDPEADRYREDRPFCQPHPHFAVHFDAYADGFGTSNDILNVNFDARARQDRADANLIRYSHLANVEILGSDIVPAEHRRSDETINLTHTWNLTRGEERESVDIYETSIPIGGAFPVTLGVKLVGTIGAAWSVDAETRFGRDDEGCFEVNLGTGASVQPFGELSAEGRVGLGVPGLSGGAYVSVDLLTVRLPMEGELTLRLTDVDSEIGIRGDIDLTVDTLSGEVGLYVEALLWEKKWGKSWPSIPLVDVELLGIDYTYPVEFWELIVPLF